MDAGPANQHSISPGWARLGLTIVVTDPRRTTAFALVAPFLLRSKVAAFPGAGASGDLSESAQEVDGP
jgi:hypothetical protein